MEFRLREMSRHQSENEVWWGLSISERRKISRGVDKPTDRGSIHAFSNSQSSYSWLLLIETHDRLNINEAMRSLTSKCKKTQV